MPQVTTVKVVEGDSHLVIRVNFLGDGLADLEKFVILSPSDLVPPRPNNAVAFRLMQAWFGLSNFDVQLGYNSVVNAQPAWTLAKGTDSHVDFRSFGGLMDYATLPPTDVDGKLWVNTYGLTTVGQVGSLVLELRKASVK